MNKKILIIICAVIILGIIGTAVVLGGNDTNVIKSDLDSLKSSKWEIKITSIDETSQIGKITSKIKSQEGATFVVVNYQYTNISGKPVSVITNEYPSLQLIAKNKAKYGYDGSLSGAYKKANGIGQDNKSEYTPGVVYKNAQVFQVPKEEFEAGGWNLLVTSGINYIPSIIGVVNIN